MIDSGIKDLIGQWFADGANDFDVGIALLKLVNRNVFYVRNIERAKKISTVRYELKKNHPDLRPPLLKEKEGKGVGSVNPPLIPPPPRGTKQPNTDPPEAPPPVGGVSGPAARDGKIVLRNEFPFLDDKDLPDELKVIVADMISAHARYVKAHDTLFEVAHKGETACFDAASAVVDNYLENRLCWDELEHYKKTGKTLGKHPVFAQKNKEDKYTGMNEAELKKRQNDLLRQIKYRNDLLKKPESTKPGAKTKGDTVAELTEIRKEMELVKKYLQRWQKRK